ncbi:histone deacetylase [Thecaphora frezii]
MVFIVRIPNHNRTRGNTPDPSSESSAIPAPPASQQQPIPTSSSLASQDRATGASTSISSSDITTDAPSSSVTSPPAASPSMSASVSQASRPAALDILLAPAVLNHRYVRGVDKSLIVERPERIRAVLLGIAGAIGKQPEHGEADADDLAARLSSLSVQPLSAASATAPPFRVLHSTRSLALDPPHPSVGYVHAHSEELVEVLESAYYDAKRKRQQARQSKFGQDDDPTIIAATAASSASFTDPESTSSPQPTSASTSHSAYVAHLSSRAPSEPPLPQAAIAPAQQERAKSSSARPNDAASSSSKAASVTDESEDYTSSDGEGDEAMHPSEIPVHLPQGDLYLAGATDDQDQGGSSQAIRHAMGACAEAVDRVVAASRAERSSGGDSKLAAPIEKLPEIRYGDDGIFRPADPGGSSAMGAAPAPLDTSDGIASPPAKRTFVLSRPPGHHCSGSTPSGFCWVNNAVVAAAHGYLYHKIDRVVIFDIDLHHGNGTQALAWRINADSQRHDLDREAQLAELRASAIERNRFALKLGPRGRSGAAAAAAASAMVDEEALSAQVAPRGLRIFYSSIHDIESFPCEDGDPDLIKDASVCVEGAHGQWIWNVHLDHYDGEDEFYRLYEERYSILFDKAARFLQRTAATPESTLVLISAGFDACSYEYPGMQRHGKHVPPSFYDRFARDTTRFSEQWAEGKVISMLEGGYSDRALCSAAMAHVIGLAGVPATAAQQPVGRNAVATALPEPAWKLDNLVHLEKMAKKMAAAAAAAASGALTSAATRRRGPDPPSWVSRSSRAFAAFERCCGKKEIVPLGFPSGASSSSQVKPKRTTAAASTASSPGGTVTTSGRVLRDRSALKQRTTWDPSSPSSTVRGTSGVAEGRSVTLPKASNRANPARQPAAAASVAAAAAGSGPSASTQAKPETLPSSEGSYAPSSPTLGHQLLQPKPEQLNSDIDPALAAGGQPAGSGADTTPIKTEAYADKAPPVSVLSVEPSASAGADQLTSRIGSVTPKADGIQSTPVMLVDAMQGAFPPSSAWSPGELEGLPPPASSSYGPSYGAGFVGQGLSNGFAEGLQQRRSSLGLLVQGPQGELKTPESPGSLAAAKQVPMAGGSAFPFASPVALALHVEQRSTPPHSGPQPELPLDMTAMQYYNQQLATQQRFQQQQQQQQRQGAAASSMFQARYSMGTATAAPTSLPYSSSSSTGRPANGDARLP